MQVAFVDWVRGLLLAILAVAIIGKVGGGTEFASSLHRMKLVSQRLAGPVAVSIAVTEAAICLMALVPHRGVLVLDMLLAAACFGAFSVGLLLVFRRKNSTPCRCFGASDKPVSLLHVNRNLALTLISIAGALTVSQLNQEVHFVNNWVALGAGVFSGIVVTRLDDIIDLFS
ncbi:methylamine utilization protein MauE [Actinocorallia aurea]